ncbi:hypothetical protein L484_004932 [Morus notabilis]|uniref:WAT1-related protein n=1 Tax=Morus notabilis TaxID=981085 RepID=W9SIP8_9ROSA|nr:hypothetical protein L484_004932 [Morus notabilis]
MEKLDLRNSKGQIKISGTIVSISGALIVTIYKGPAIVVPQSQSTPNTSLSPKLSSLMNLTAASNWIIGGLFLAFTWCIDKKGPVFAVMFKPVGIASAAFHEHHLSRQHTLYRKAQSEEGKVENNGVVDELQSSSPSL